MHAPHISLVVPFYNESANVRPLCLEMIEAKQTAPIAEIVLVDDASTDDTFAQLQAIRQEYSGQFTVVRHRARCGQSSALASGIRAASEELIVTLDGDGQNNPADIPSLLAALPDDDTDQPVMITGTRVGRKDSFVRRASSVIANRVRAALLRDNTPDTGCGLKMFRREDFLQLPNFDHMHRFLPALFKRAGGIVICVDVSHRPRIRGKSKYGINNRLWVGIVDLFGVAWLMRRSKLPEVEIYK